MFYALISQYMENLSTYVQPIRGKRVPLINTVVSRRCYGKINTQCSYNKQTFQITCVPIIRAD